MTSNMTANILKSITLFVLFPLFFFIPFVSAKEGSFDEKKFYEYNPDGQKYQFVKDFLISLSYFKLNADRNENNAYDLPEGTRVKDRVDSLSKSLAKDNINLRIGRNFLKKYNTSDNGLILKAVQLFTKVCDEQAQLNNQEKTLLDRLLIENLKKGPPLYNLDNFYKDQSVLQSRRKESLKMLLEASFLVNRILISHKPDKFGEFVTLGITQAERTKLLNKLNELFGVKSDGGVKVGQTFLQASIEAIRVILEDKTWLTLDT